MPNPKAVTIVLSDGEREQLEGWARRRKSAQALAQRSRIVLAAAEGLKNTEIAERLGIHRGMAAKWRSRFAEQRLDGLVDEPRPGRPRTVTDSQVEQVIIKTLESTPKDATHWSTRSMAAEVGLSQSAVSRIWRAFGLQPHRQETWKLSRDPQFVAKVRDVVGLYLDPPERAVVLCVDEKSQIQALDRTAPILPMLPGTPATRDPRLQALGHLQPLRRTGHHHGQGHRVTTCPPPRDRVQEVPRHARSRGPLPARRSPHPRQRLHPQDASDPTLAGRPPPIRPALHANLKLMAEPRRTLVLRTDNQKAAPRQPHLSATTQHRHPRLDQQLEPKPPPVHLDQNRRPNPRIGRPLLHPNQRLTTLAPWPRLHE